MNLIWFLYMHLCKKANKANIREVGSTKDAVNTTAL